MVIQSPPWADGEGGLGGLQETLKRTVKGGVMCISNVKYLSNFHQISLAYQCVCSIKKARRMMKDVQAVSVICHGRKVGTLSMGNRSNFANYGGSQRRNKRIGRIFMTCLRPAPSASCFRFCRGLFRAVSVILLHNRHGFCCGLGRKITKKEGGQVYGIYRLLQDFRRR